MTTENNPPACVTCRHFIPGGRFSEPKCKLFSLVQQRFSPVIGTYTHTEWMTCDTARNAIGPCKFEGYDWEPWPETPKGIWAGIKRWVFGL